MTYYAESVEVSSMTAHVLTNVGLLRATLLESGDQEVMQIGMVVQVNPAGDGSLIRSIFNPLE